VIKQAKEIIKNATSIVGLTGAGISTASGIPDFRSPESGMWGRVDPFTVASIQGFHENPQNFYDWVMPLAEQTRKAQPNAAHIALAQMEAAGPLKAVITQNIDMLHTKAGSQTVYEVHGHMRSARCIVCQAEVDGETVLATVVQTKLAPFCQRCGGAIKPDVILFGELLPFKILHDAQAAVESCDVMIVVGSSLEVAPVNSMPMKAKENGAKLIIVNFQPTHLDRIADCVIYEDVVDVLPQFADVFLK
jgi:NAD-dependent deacetylase